MRLNISGRNISMAEHSAADILVLSNADSLVFRTLRKLCDNSMSRRLLRAATAAWTPSSSSDQSDLRDFFTRPISLVLQRIIQRFCLSRSLDSCTIFGSFDPSFLRFTIRPGLCTRFDFLLSRFTSVYCFLYLHFILFYFILFCLIFLFCFALWLV